MPHMHWVARQNKLELPNDEEEVNTQDIHKCNGQAHDPVTVVCILFLFNFGVFFLLSALDILIIHRVQDELPANVLSRCRTTAGLN